MRFYYSADLPEFNLKFFFVAKLSYCFGTSYILFCVHGIGPKFAGSK